MDGVFRSIAVTICGWIYPLIPPLYGVFYDLANGEFFTEGTIDALSNNLYVLVSVVMLFTFAIQLIKSIVNPDMLSDKKKGTLGFVKRAGLSLLIIVLIPWAFNQMYSIQSHILGNNLIEKIIVGYSGDGVGSIAKKSNAGQVLAASIIVDLLYPKEGAKAESGDILQQDYNLMIESDIEKIKDVGDRINEKYSPTGDAEATDDQKEYVFEFQPLIAIIAGGFTLYMLIIFCLDMGVRLVKLALLEITAPVSIMAYIYGGDENMKRWFKEVSSTYLQVYIKIAALSFVIFALQHVDTFMQSIQSDHTWLVKLFIIIGLLTLAHKLPDLVKSLFGVSYTPKGGIEGRLGEMAGVGKLAKSGWQKMKKAGVAIGTGGVIVATAGAGAGGIGLLTGAGAAGGLAYGGNKLWKEKLKDTKGGRVLTAIGKTAGAYLNSSNPIKGTSEAIKAYKGTDLAKEQQYRKDNARTTNMNNDAKATARAASGVYTDGKVDKSKLKENAIDTHNITVDNMVQKGKISKDNAQTVKSYNESRHKNMTAASDYNKNEQIIQGLTNAQNATSDSDAKRQIGDLISKVSQGGMTPEDLKNAMKDVKLYSADGLGTGTQVISTQIQDSINNLAKSITLNADTQAFYSTQSYKQIMENTSAAFSTSEKNYNKMLEVVGEHEKAAIKATTGVGKDLSKSELGIL